MNLLARIYVHMYVCVGRVSTLPRSSFFYRNPLHSEPCRSAGLSAYPPPRLRPPADLLFLASSDVTAVIHLPLLIASPTMHYNTGRFPSRYVCSSVWKMDRLLCMLLCALAEPSVFRFDSVSVYTYIAHPAPGTYMSTSNTGCLIFILK